MSKLLKKAHGKHSKFCPLGGFKGADNCRHAANCCCEGGERVDFEYAMDKVQGLMMEAYWWSRRAAESA